MKRHSMIALATLVALIACTSAAKAEDSAKGEAKPREQVEKARILFESLMNDDNMTWLREELPKAKGIFIVPQYLRAGFIFGGSGGSGVYLARDKDTGEWSYPAFYTMGGASVGLQAGADSAETVILARTERGAEMFLRTKFTLGPDVTVTAGPVGAGAKANIIADLVSIARTKGVYGGLSVEGLVIQPRASLNTAYYGQPELSAADVLIKRKVENDHADALRADIAKASAKK